MAIRLQDTNTTFTVKDSDLGMGGDPDTIYTLRQLTRADYKRVLQANTKQVVNRFTRAMEPVTDHVAAEEDLLDHALVSWEGVFHADGRTAECSRENKLNGLPGSILAALLELAGRRV